MAKISVNKVKPSGEVELKEKVVAVNRVVKTTNSKPVVTNGPFGEIKETIGGFIIVKADSIDEAVDFAKGCPVLQGEGNSMEVRKIAKNDGTH